MSNVTYNLTTTNQFQPNYLSDCQFWYDANDLGTITLSGSNVTNWADKSGNSRNLVRFTTPGPFLTSNFNGSFRTVEAISASNGNMVLSNIPSSAMQGSTGSSFFMVFNYLSGVVIAQYAEPRFFSMEGSNRYDYGPLGANVVYNLPSGFTYCNAQIFGQTVDVTGTRLRVYQTGTERSNVAVTPISLSYTLNFNFFAVSGGTLQAYMRLSEFIGYNRLLSTAERQQVEGYLAWKWGLQQNLPAGHPYLNQPVYFFSPTISQFTNSASLTLTTTNQFQPNYISGNTLWLDAQDTGATVGNPVTQWTDKSGLGFNATQASANAPTIGSFNGLRTVTFNGTSQRLVSNNTVPANTHTLIAVHRPAVITGNGQGNTSLFRYQPVNSTYIVFPYMQGTTPRGYITSFDGIPLDAGNSLLRENAVTTAFNIIVANINSGSQQIFRNGSLENQNTQSLTVATSQTLVIGYFPPGNSEYYQGDLGEMIVYNRNLSTAEQQQVEGYLAWKWGLQLSLPTTHPYRNQNTYFFSPTISQLTIPTGLRPAFFTPLSILNSVVWLDPADPGTVVLSGTTISSVRDKSPTGATFDQGSTKPLNTNPINGLGTMNFVTGASVAANGLGTSTTTPYNNITQFSLFVVNRPTYGSLTLGYAPCFFANRSATTTAISWHIQNNYSGFISWNGSTNALPTLTIAQNELNLFEVIQGASSLVPYKNGNVSGTISYTITARTGIPCSVGNSTASGSEGFVGQICEVLYYSRTLTDIERQSVEGYLCWKWGLQGNLPATHPFRLFPPPP